MTKLAEEILAVLTAHLGARMAYAVTHAAAAESRIDFEALQSVELAKLLDVVDRHLGTSIHDPTKLETCMRELRHTGPHLAPTPSLNALMIIPLLREEDVMRVRGVILKLTRANGFSEERQTLVVTAVVGLATDLRKRGRRGTLVFRKLAAPSGLEVTAFEGDKAPAGPGELASLHVRADQFVADSQPHMGTTIRATWFKNPADAG